MNFMDKDGDIPTVKASVKKAQLAKDEKIKSFWDKLVDDWLSWRNTKPSEKDNAKD